MLVVTHPELYPANCSAIWKILCCFFGPVVIKENVFGPWNSMNLSESAGGRMEKWRELRALEAPVGLDS